MRTGTRAALVGARVIFVNRKEDRTMNTAENLNSILSEILEFTAKNKGVLKLTKTMLKKSTIDANQSIRQLARLFGVDYEDMEPNSKDGNKIVFNGVRIPYVCESLGVESTVSFYKTVRGDRRISIQKIKEFAGEGDTLSLMWAKNESGELILIIKGA
tara:strand:- start:253 stop:726 length:474 start_codon:yes stop_codon:yes gene_type:complete